MAEVNSAKIFEQTSRTILFDHFSYTCTGGGALFTVTDGDCKKVVFKVSNVLTNDTELRGNNICTILTEMSQGVAQKCRCSLST